MKNYSLMDSQFFHRYTQHSVQLPKDLQNWTLWLSSLCPFIVSSRVGTPPPFSEGTPSFWNKFKKLPTSFWEPSKLVHVNCKNTLKWRCYVSYYTKSIENIINITLFTFRLNSVFYYLHFLWLNMAFNVFHTWCARGMNMKHF